MATLQLEVGADKIKSKLIEAAFQNGFEKVFFEAVFPKPLFQNGFLHLKS